MSVGLMALALTACAPSGDIGNGTEAASDQPPILDLLRSGDIAACAHPYVLSIFQDNSRVSFDDARTKLSITRDQYDAVDPVALEFRETSASEVNKDIAEIKCNANVYGMGRNLGSVNYAVRPDASGSGIVAWYDDKLGGIMAFAKLDHMTELERAIPQSRAPATAPSIDPQSSNAPDAAEPSGPTPATDFQKAQAALAEEPPTKTSTGN